METWYRIGRHSKDLIEKISVVKSTGKTITVIEKDWNGRAYEARSAIASDIQQHFRTWDAAYAALLAKSELKLADSHMQLERVKGYHGNVVGLAKQRPADADQEL